MKIKVLFIRSGNKGQHPITQNQGDSLQAIGCEMYYFNVVGKGWWGYLKNLPALKRQISIVQPDVLHAHYSLCGFLATLVFFRGPLVVSLMGSDVITSGKFFKRIIKFFIRHWWDLVIVKSQEMRDLLKGEQVLIFPNGVNPIDFYPMDKKMARQKLGWPEDVFIPLFPSDPLRTEKNYPLFKSVVELMAGKGFRIEEKHLFNLSKVEMNLYYNAADVLILTSQYEGSPNVIKEAMFCQCPFVSVDVGDVAYWIKKTNGNVMTGGSANELMDGVFQVIKAGHVVENGKAIEELSAERIALGLKMAYIGCLEK